MATIINGVPESPLEDSLLKPAEVAAAFRVHAATVKKWATAGKPTVIRTPGGHRRYRESEVRALLGIAAGSRAGAGRRRSRSRTRAGELPVMSLDDALTIAGQVLADYDASGMAVSAGVEGIWPGRLAQALRDLAAAATAWYASPSGQPSHAVLDTTVGQLQDAITRMDAQAARLEVASTALATQPARPRRSGRWRRLTHGQARPQPERREPGSVLLSASEADIAWQAAADAAAWHAEYGDCSTCVDSGACADPSRHEAITAEYAQLRSRIGGAWR